MSLSRLSLLLPPVGPWHNQLPGYRWAEEVGYDVVYTADHLTHPTVPGRWMGEAFTTLTAAATVTDRIRLGTLVASSWAWEQARHSVRRRTRVLGRP